MKNRRKDIIKDTKAITLIALIITIIILLILAGITIAMLFGENSIIRTTYMIVNSRDIRYSKIPLDSFYDNSRDGSLPESWNSINFFKKDIIAWRLSNDVGIGENEKMFNGCASWIEDRYNSGKLDWIFYHGMYDTFKDNYTGISNLELPIYKIDYINKKITKQIKTQLTKGEEKHNIFKGGGLF